MAKLHMVHVKNGEGNNPLYQISTKNTDGEYVVAYYKLLKEHQAVAYLAEHSSEEDPEEVMVTVTEETTIVPDYKNMTKLQLEEVMREYDIELDRRKSKKDLLKVVKNFFN
jgi:hypothetical protein